MNLRDFEKNIQMELKSLIDYAVYFQEFDSDSNKWSYKQKTFTTVDQAKSFAAGVLKIYPDNSVIIKSKEYRLFFENGMQIKKYSGKENFIIKSTPERNEMLLKEVCGNPENNNEIISDMQPIA
jgi:hypothetical protein